MSEMERTGFPHGEKFADDEDFEGWDQERGMPTIGLASRALQVWSILQSRPKVTVREAALAFNLDDDQVRQLVEHHPWMFLGDPDDDATLQTIEHDGE